MQKFNYIAITKEIPDSLLKELIDEVNNRINSYLEMIKFESSLEYWFLLNREIFINKEFI